MEKTKKRAAPPDAGQGQQVGGQSAVSQEGPGNAAVAAQVSEPEAESSSPTLDAFAAEEEGYEQEHETVSEETTKEADNQETSTPNDNSAPPAAPPGGDGDGAPGLEAGADQSQDSAQDTESAAGAGAAAAAAPNPGWAGGGDGLTPPTSVSISVGGAVVNVAIPAGLEGKTTTVALGASPVRGLTLSSATLSFDETWRPIGGTVKGSLAMGLGGASVTAPVSMQIGSGGVVSSSLTGVSIASAGMTGTLNATLGSGGISGSGKFALGPGFPLFPIKAGAGALEATLSGTGKTNSLRFAGSELQSFTGAMGASVASGSLGTLGQGEFSGTYNSSGTISGAGSMTLTSSLPLGPAACQATIASGLTTTFDVAEGGATLVQLGGLSAALTMNGTQFGTLSSKKATFDGSTVDGVFDGALDSALQLTLGPIGLNIKGGTAITATYSEKGLAVTGGSLDVDVLLNGQTLGSLNWAEWGYDETGLTGSATGSLALPALDLSSILEWLGTVTGESSALPSWLQSLLEKLGELPQFQDVVSSVVDKLSNLEPVWPDPFPLSGSGPDIASVLSGLGTVWGSLWEDISGIALGPFDSASLSALFMDIGLPGLPEWLSTMSLGAGAVTAELSTGSFYIQPNGLGFPLITATGVNAGLFVNGESVGTLNASEVSYDGSTLTATAQVTIADGYSKKIGDREIRVGGSITTSIVQREGEPLDLELGGLEVSVFENGQEAFRGELSYFKFSGDKVDLDADLTVSKEFSREFGKLKVDISSGSLALKVVQDEVQGFEIRSLVGSAGTDSLSVDIEMSNGIMEDGNFSGTGKATLANDLSFPLGGKDIALKAGSALEVGIENNTIDSLSGTMGLTECEPLGPNRLKISQVDVEVGFKQGELETLKAKNLKFTVGDLEGGVEGNFTEIGVVGTGGSYSFEASGGSIDPVPFGKFVEDASIKDIEVGNGKFSAKGEGAVQVHKDAKIKAAMEFKNKWDPTVSLGGEIDMLLMGQRDFFNKGMTEGPDATLVKDQAWKLLDVKIPGGLVSGSIAIRAGMNVGMKDARVKAAIDTIPAFEMSGDGVVPDFKFDVDPTFGAFASGALQLEAGVKLGNEIIGVGVTGDATTTGKVDADVKGGLTMAYKDGVLGGHLDGNLDVTGSLGLALGINASANLFCWDAGPLELYKTNIDLGESLKVSQGMQLDFGGESGGGSEGVISEKTTESLFASKEPGQDVEKGGPGEDASSTLEKGMVVFNSFSDVGTKLSGLSSSIFVSPVNYSDVVSACGDLMDSFIKLADELKNATDDGGVLTELEKDGGTVLEVVIGILRAYGGAVDALDGTGAKELSEMGYVHEAVSSRAVVILSTVARLAEKLEAQGAQGPQKAGTVDRRKQYYWDNMSLAHMDEDARDADQEDINKDLNKYLGIWYRIDQPIVDSFYPGEDTSNVFQSSGIADHVAKAYRARNEKR
jgi:hypothetical protein